MKKICIGKMLLFSLLVFCMGACLGNHFVVYAGFAEGEGSSPLPQFSPVNSTSVVQSPTPTVSAQPIKPPVYDGKLSFKKKSVKIKKGKMYQLSLKLTKKNRSGKRITYRSSKPKVATVSQYGKVKGKKAGKTTITAKLGKAKARCKITVEEIKTITVSAAGDCTLGTDQAIYSSIDFNHIYEKKDASYFLKNVKSVFGKDDLTLVNLEGTLTNRGSRQDKTFAFRGKPEYINILKKGSVEAVSFANNHCYDYGQVSYDDTVNLLNKNKITYSSFERIAVRKIKGIRVGMISVTWTGDTAGTLRNAIAKMKKKKHDLLIVSFHCGIERNTVPDDTQVMLSRIAIDEGGADMVIGHHPHVLQGIEKYHGSYIAYSLGNFCFGGNTDPADKDTMILQQTFTFVNGKKKADDNLKIIPCCLSSTKEYNNYQPTISKGKEKSRIIGKINGYSKTYGVQFDKNGKVKK